MKKPIIVLLSLFPFFLSAQFITTWDTTKSGTSCNSCITIPTTGGGYSYNVDWENDGIIDDFGITGNFTHDYGSPGVYQVAITGAFPRIYINSQYDRRKILSVDQWGSNPWQSMDRAFLGAQNCENLANDVPNLSNVISMSNCFSSASVWNGNMSDWDVSNVGDFWHMFANAIAFDSDISDWDVGSGVNFAGMFRNTPFDQDIGDWDMSNAYHLGLMFSGNSSFNQDIGDWDVSNVEFFFDLFRDAIAFNQDIGNWDTSSGKYMENAFDNASAFNQDIGNWNTSSVEGMGYMFRDASSFDQDLSGWDVANVIYIQNMFLNTTLSTANYDALLIGWDAQNLKSGLSFHGGNSQYCQGESARDNMINNDGWTIYDAGLDPGCIQGPPSCTNLNTPLDGATNVSIFSIISWDPVTGADGYQFSLGTSPGGTEIANNMDIGNNTGYYAGNGLPCGTTIYVTVVPYHNNNGDAMGCIEESFTTESVVADAGSDVSICAGDDTQLNGTGGVSFSWSPATGLDDPSSATPIAAPLITTTYTLTTSSTYGCSDTDIVVVTVNNNFNCCDDIDLDGYAAIWCGGNDCDDNDPNVFPGFGINATDEWIESISLSGTTETTGNSGGYADYTLNPPFNATIDAIHSMELTPGYIGGDTRVYWRVYIDYNNNGEFEHGAEREVQATGFGPLVKNLTIPPNATEGIVKMKVIMSTGGYQLPCAGNFDGEIEDYSLMINACDPILDAGVIGGSQAICASANDPTMLTNVLDAGVGIANVEYQWMMNTDYCELPVDGVDNGWDDIVGATNADYDPGPLSETTVFIRAARSVGCLQYIYSNMIEVVNTIDCVPDCSSSAAASPTMWIKRVKLGTMANNSDDDGGYGDYTAMTSTVTQGKKIPYQLRQGFTDSSSDMFWTVWVDWNQDGFYSDLCEVVLQRTDNITLNGKITVPANALPGNTTFRVSMSTVAYADDCAQGFDGEVEDYSMVVVADPNAMFAFDNTSGFQIYIETEEEEIEINQQVTSSNVEFGFYPNPANERLHINLPEQNIGDDLSILNSIGQVMYQQKITESGVLEIPLNEHGFTNGMHFISIKGVDSNHLLKVFIQK